MPDSASLDAIRAAVDTVVPAAEGLPGALAMGVDRHVVDLIEQSFPGFVDLIAALLNAYAMDVIAGASFAELTVEERSVVLRNMSTDDSQDIRDAVDALIVFTSGGSYSEWSRYERETGKLAAAPATWVHVGFHGPSHGHPTY
ncbi:MAG: gluconate 2-dehydrogenase subunit 3 family protein, partial [Actinomycetota bacterium]